MEKRPVILVVMDGIGIREDKKNNAVALANKPTLDKLWAECPHTQLRAHGLAVGLPTDSDMGNSEVGHNALGCGQIYSQGAKLVNENIESGEIFNSKTWKELAENAKNSKMHFIGLLSDGNVHSNISHLKALIKEAKNEGIKEVRIHALLDGRDVPATSALEYVSDIESFMAELNDDNFHACIASGGGRMQITMDRYEADWSMVERGWHIHVMGDGRKFASCKEAIETYRAEGNYTDQYLPGFVIADGETPVGTIDDGDSVILYNFRGDRAVEFSKCFDDMDTFDKFDMVKKPKVYYAGMLQYDGDLKLPKNFLVEPPHIEHTMSEFLVEKGVHSYAVSETQKFGHMTYFWNGNRSEKFDESLETYVEIPSDVVPFEQRPWMKAAEITDKLCEAIESGNYDFIRTNYPNGDMVGHTGSLPATIIGVESVDLELARVIESVNKVNGILLVTADHGNADDESKTSHTLAPVPFIVYNAECELKEGDDLGLSNVAATVCDFLGLEPNEHWNPSLKK